MRHRMRPQTDKAAEDGVGGIRLDGIVDPGQGQRFAQRAIAFFHPVNVNDKARRCRGLLSQITSDFGSHRTQIPSVLPPG